jgi:large subunit ribosomal protein L9
MKVLLVKDVYKLGHAGDVKKVADGFGRNFLLPQGMAVLATPGAIKTAERIRAKATERRAILNNEMSAVAEILKKVQISFGARAGETGKLYGSITSQEVADAIQQKSGVAVKRQQLDMQPLRTLGEHTGKVKPNPACLSNSPLPRWRKKPPPRRQNKPPLPTRPDPPKKLPYSSPVQPAWGKPVMFR